jgi:hypothetical protein
MKRFFTLLVSVFALTATGWAQDEGEDLDQTFVFIDDQGNIVPDGSVITVAAINDEGQMVVPLKVKNVEGDGAAVSMYETIDALPNGGWQTCAFGNCMTLSATGYSAKNIISGTDASDIQTEWMPEQGKYATWTATLQIHVFNIITKTVFGMKQEVAGEEIIGYGPKVTVNFVYNSESAHISGTAADHQPKEYFNVRGQRIDGPQKGLNIIRLANGKTIKTINK